MEGHELYNEINDKLFSVELELMDYALENINTVKPKKQEESSVTYYRKRTPGDSRIDPDKSLANQFLLLRVSDPDRFPAFMDCCGYRYQLKLEKIKLLTDSD